MGRRRRQEPDVDQGVVDRLLALLREGVDDRGRYPLDVERMAWDSRKQSPQRLHVGEIVAALERLKASGLIRMKSSLKYGQCIVLNSDQAGEKQHEQATTEAE